ncbi:MAG: hypothetical protein ACYDB7_15765 [Mycobacteriales bacterium]
MSAERDELRRLVDDLLDAEVPAALADVRRHLPRRVDRAWPPPWFASAQASRPDTAARAEEILAEGFVRSR